MAGTAVVGNPKPGCRRTGEGPASLWGGGDVTVDCKDLKSFPWQRGVDPSEPMAQMGRWERQQVWLSIRSNFLLILRRERREELAHFQQRLANYLAGG